MIQISDSDFFIFYTICKTYDFNSVCRNYKIIKYQCLLSMTLFITFCFVFPFQPLLYVGFTEDSALVVVERPWRAMLEKLPPPLYRKKYGM